MLKAAEGHFTPGLGVGVLDRGELVEEEKRRQEAPTTRLQCQAWKHGVGEWDQREETGDASEWVPAPLSRGSLVSKVNQISLLEGSGHLVIRAWWLRIWGRGVVGSWWSELLP